MIRALIGEGIFGLCPQIYEDSVTFWRLIINEESILGKPCELLDIDSGKAIAIVLIPEEMDQVSDKFELKRIQ